jgi:hypothetical protein
MPQPSASAVHVNVPLKTKKAKAFAISAPRDVATAASACGSDREQQAALTRLAKRLGPTYAAQIPKVWAATDAARPHLITRFLDPDLSAIALTTPADGQPATSWGQVFKTGKFWDERYGWFSITPKDLVQVEKNFRLGQATQGEAAPINLPFDYNHGTSKPASAELGKASGWIRDVELRANGEELWALVEWTPEAAEMIAAKEYQFVSPTFQFNYTHSNGQKLGTTLLAAAITNRPVLEGMAPLTLSAACALRLADAPPAGTATDGGDEDEAAEDLFSYDEQRRRVQAALAEAFGALFGVEMCGGCYLIDIFDGRAIYRDPDGTIFRVPYTIAATGAVTFTAQPVEARIDYPPLAAGEQTMSKVKDLKKTPPPSVDDAAAAKPKTHVLKDAKGNDVEMSEETLSAWAAGQTAGKSSAPAPAETDASADDDAGDVSMAKVVELQRAMDEKDTKIVSLSKRVETMELERRTDQAKAEVDTLVRAGKATNAERASLLKLALKDHDMFVELTKDRPKLVDLSGPIGSEGDLAGDAEAGVLQAAIDAAKKANPKLSDEQAYALAMQQHPELYEMAAAAPPTRHARRH